MARSRRGVEVNGPHRPLVSFGFGQESIALARYQRLGVPEINDAIRHATSNNTKAG